jgi:hypothetical protein
MADESHPATPSPDPLYTTRQAAAYFGCSPSLLAVYRVQGCGPRYFLVGNRPRYRRSDLDSWLETRARQSTVDAGPVEP